MLKKNIAIIVMIALAVILIINVIDLNKKESGPNLVDVTGDTSVKGVSIVSPNAKFLNEGDLAPDFEVPMIDGERIKLSNLKGQKVLVNFWATWCPPCKEEMPELQRFYEEYGDQIKIIAINATGSERNEQVVRNFLEEKDYTFPVGIDKNNKITDQYLAMTIPTSYFIGSDGVIQVPRHVGPMTYDFMVDMLNSLN
ncbi:TlpA family protein disulfide reductase [Ornithinibacillus bavariensis]|uniref:TlpA family protein disulfide reductase n=1 Tax=Ornithinibacillus bavariensis TaxID=545502 RepID=UPI000EE848FB|nr:cytochrome C biogenesis protein [Ornithinibacillus sp.]